MEDEKVVRSQGGLKILASPTFTLKLTFHTISSAHGFHALLQGIFPTQGLNTGLLHSRQILYQLSYQGSPPAGENGVNKAVKNGTK